MTSKKNSEEQVLFPSADEPSEVLEVEVVDDDSPSSLPASVQNTFLAQNVADNYIVPVNEYNLVNQSPNMIMTTSLLSFNAQRLLRTVIGLISDNDKPGKVYTFTIEDYKRLYNLKGYPSQQIMRAGVELGQRFKLSDPANPSTDGIVIGWIDSVQVKEGIVTVRFLPELLQLYRSWRTFSYNLGNTKDFQVSYTFSFYEYCLSVLKNNTSVVFYMNLKELWDFFKLGNRYMKNETEYEYSNFKRRVLKKIELDINGSDPAINPCNINLKFKDKKSGKKVVGVTFSVSRVAYDQKAPEKVSNPFYDGLRPDTKAYYDAALSANIDAVEIERSIINYRQEGFRQIMEYNLTKNKDKGSFYWLACLRNGWVDNRSQNRFSFKNIDKSVRLLKEAYQDYDLFVHSLDEAHVTTLFRYVSKVFSKDRPQLSDYMNRTSHENILKEEGYMIFVLEVVKDIVKNESPKEFYDWFIKWENNKVNSSSLRILSSSGDGFFAPALPEQSDSGIDFDARKEIVSKLESEGITDKKILSELLEHTDDYINANIDYCIRQYRDRKRQADISGAIISAVKDDYAGYQVSLKNKIQKAKSAEDADAEILKGIAQAKAESELSGKVKEVSDDELNLMLEEFASNGEKRLKDIVEKESKKRKKEGEIQELRDYFFRLSEIEQANIFIEAKTANNVAFQYAKGINSYEDMWNSPALNGFIIKATKDFRKNNSLPDGVDSIEKLDAYLEKENS